MASPRGFPERRSCGQCPAHLRTGGVRKRYGVSQCESESITPGRPVARSHRDRRSAGRRSGVVSAYILNKNPSASSNSVKTASPCRGASHEKYSATYVLKSSISSIGSMEPRKDWSGLYSRVCIPGSFYSLQPTARSAGSRSAGHRSPLQSLLKLSPGVTQLDSPIEHDPLGLR